MIAANILALISSFLAVVFLTIAAFRVGGSIGKALKMIALGIFFAVFIHAGFELAETYNIISSEALMPVMGTLLTFGSILLSIAGYIGLKAFE